MESSLVYRWLLDFRSLGPVMAGWMVSGVCVCVEEQRSEEKRNIARGEGEKETSCRVDVC